MQPLDIEQSSDLIRHLRVRALIGADETPTVTALTGGVSNRTVLIERSSGESWVAKQALEKLRVAADWYSSPERIHREALALRRLPALAPPGTITPLVDEDRAAHIIVMAAVPQPHANWKSMLLDHGPQGSDVSQFATLIATIHRRSREEMSSIAAEFDDRSFFESLRLEPYYAFSYEQVPSASFVYDLIDATRLRRHALVHGDYSPKNIFVQSGKLILLDHEVIHFGDPAFDVGFALTHLLSKAHHFAGDIQKRMNFLLCAVLFWSRYKRTLGPTDWDPDFERFVVLHTLGCLLARAVGRSPLEYLTIEQRERQRNIVLRLAARNLATVDGLLGTFGQELEAIYAAN